MKGIFEKLWKGKYHFRIEESRAKTERNRTHVEKGLRKKRGRPTRNKIEEHTDGEKLGKIQTKTKRENERKGKQNKLEKCKEYEINETIR